MKKLQKMVLLMCLLCTVGGCAQLFQEPLTWARVPHFRYLRRNNIPQTYGWDPVIFHEGFFSYEEDVACLYSTYTDYLYGNRENAIMIEKEEFKTYFDGLSDAAREVDGLKDKELEDLQGLFLVIISGVKCKQINGYTSIWVQDLYEVAASYALTTNSRSREYAPGEIEVWCYEKSPLPEKIKAEVAPIYRLMWDPRPYGERELRLYGKLIVYSEIAPNAKIGPKNETIYTLAWDAKMGKDESNYILLNIDEKQEGELILGYGSEGEAVIDPKYEDQWVEIIGYIPDSMEIMGLSDAAYIQIDVDKIRLLEKREIGQ